MASLTSQQRQDLIEELPRLKRFCLSLTSDPTDADDLLQITVERLLEKGMPEDAHVAKWSHRVCRNLWIDEIRSRDCLLYTSPSPRDRTRSRMPTSA